MNALQVYAGGFHCAAPRSRHHRLRFQRVGPPKRKTLFFWFSFSGLLLCSDYCETKTVECVFFFLFSLRKYKVKTMSPAITISRKRKRRGNNVTLVRRNVTMVVQLFTGSLVSYNFMKLSKCNCKFTGKFLRNTAILYKW